jgi:hypothetical protein
MYVRARRSNKVVLRSIYVLARDGKRRKEKKKTRAAGGPCTACCRLVKGGTRWEQAAAWCLVVISCPFRYQFLVGSTHHCIVPGRYSTRIRMMVRYVLRLPSIHHACILHTASKVIIIIYKSTCYIYILYVCMYVQISISTWRRTESVLHHVLYTCSGNFSCSCVGIWDGHGTHQVLGLARGKERKGSKFVARERRQSPSQKLHPILWKTKQNRVSTTS